MAEPLTINVTQAAKAAPVNYTVPGSAEIEPLSAFAHFDGTGAASSFYPTLTFLSASGLILARVFPSASVAAGGTADVTFAPFLGGGSGSSGGLATGVPVLLDIPDATGNAYPAYTVNEGFSQVRRVVPAFQQSVLGTWEGSIIVPQSYTTAATITLTGATNASGGAVRLRVSSAVVATGVSEDTSYTNEAYVNTTVPGTVRFKHDISFVLSTVPTPGASLNIKVTRDGANAADTLAANWLLWGCLFTFS